jgi:hypothetical protein
MSNDDDPVEPFGAAELAEWRKRRLEDAKSSYNQIINRLWAGNGSGTAAAVTAIGISIKDGHAPHVISMLPLIFFVAGLIFLGIGTLVALVAETKIIREMESAQSILDLKANHFVRPSEQAGLTLSNWQTKMALGAAAAMMLGLISGVGILLGALPAR